MIASVAAGLLTYGLVGAVRAADYPSKPIRLIASSAPGSGGDIAARSLATELGRQFGQQVIVDNRPGASGIIGYELLARSAPDGHTLGYAASTFVLNPSMHAKLPYDSARDFQPVVHASSTMSVLAVTPSLPARSVKELITLARAKPGVLSYGSSGNGTPSHLSVELLKQMTGTDIVPVSYKGTQQAVTDVISNQIQLICDVISSMQPFVKTDKVRALGVTALKRSTVLPDVPTLNEAGIPGYELTTIGGYLAPARVPRDIVLRLNAEINKALLSPAQTKAIAERGSTVVGGTPEQFADFLRRDTAKWAAVIKAAGIKPQ